MTMLMQSTEPIGSYDMSKSSYSLLYKDHAVGQSLMYPQGSNSFQIGYIPSDQHINYDDVDCYENATYFQDEFTTKSSLYKTELCKRFTEFGSCRYGAKCQFAHGFSELRQVVRHPKYKTTKCKSFWGSGHCPYGSRCRFIHEENEGYQQSSPQPQRSSKSFDVDNTWDSHTDEMYLPPDCEDSMYPNFQDAIDALVKFSITDKNDDSRLGVICTKPKPIGKEVPQKDYGLDAHELWRDFTPSTEASTQWFVGRDGEEGPKNDSSPRLRIFEKFH